MLKIAFRKLSTVIKSPKLLLIKPLTYFSFLFSDKLFLKIDFYLRMGYKLDLNNPQTFNEKLCWLKLNYRKPILNNLVDKYEVKKFVADTVGAEYVIPNLGVWDTFEEIDFDLLPKQFVLKTTHDQGGVVICNNKENFDKVKAKVKLTQHLKSNHYYLSREWPYKDVKPRIIAEKFMMAEGFNDLIDYKFFCFDSVPKALFIATERQLGKVKFNYYDMDFQELNLKQSYQKSSKTIVKPEGFDTMVTLARVLSFNHPHVRVDFYDINGRVYFGELTFFHHGGHTPFYPKEWDYKFGSWIKLPSEYKNTTS